PFVGDSPVSVAYQHVREVPQPPSTFNPEVPDSIDRVVLMALAKDREDRYADAAAFREDLLAARAGRPVAAPAVVSSAAAAAAATQAMPSLGADATQAMATAPAAPAETITARRLPPEDEPSRRGRVAGYVGLLLAVLAVFALAAFLASRLLGGEPAVEQVQVPSLIGMTATEAKAELDGLGLEYAEGEPVEDADREPGTVVDQSPVAGTPLDPGGTVTVVLTVEPGEVSVPDLRGMTQQEARAELQELGLEPGVVTTEDDAEVDAGRVVRTEPESGASVPPGTQVDLVLSSGEVELPNLVGQPFQEARATLIDLGLEVVIERTPTDEQEVDHVVSQDPGPGTVEQGSTVTLVVADPPPAPTAEPTPEPTQEPPAEPTLPAPPVVPPTP
ncbi:MAG: PASTA domain-containing protein, partial [Actinomycetes bacterium]